MSSSLNVPMDYLSPEDIAKLEFMGMPAENRFLIATPIPTTTKSGLFLVENSEDLPKKGVVLQRGVITEECRTYLDIQVGDIVTYGRYAGKEIDMPHLGMEKTQTLSIISLNEVVYFEKQQPHINNRTFSEKL